MVVSIEEVSSSLVREYLSRKGLKRTIACMDEEQPRTEASINNRSDLRQILHMEGLYKNNKVSLLVVFVPHRSFVEEETCSSQGIKSLPATDTPSTHNQTDFWRDCSESRKELPLNTPFHGTESFTGRESERKTESTQKIRTNRTRRGMMAAPIASTPQTVMEFIKLLLGSSSRFFSNEWRNQGFTFSDDLKYGIMQNKGGPCGVLAAVQACLLKKLLFESADSSVTGLQRLRPSSATRTQCLVLAAAEVLWRAGEEKQATVAIHSERNHFIPTGHYKAEGVLEKFESGALSCILLTISAVLSRSVEKIREDMDVPTTSLIGAHGYCTQELVNLLLCGHAVSNVFDNDMELDSGNGNLTLLKGIKGRCDIGLLSLFEHYNICKVGTYLQTPHFPIWVVCSESHFSVLFSLQRELLTNQDRAQEFDLYYYDGLANQQEEIRLTVCTWKDASVSWNDTEPIL
uniref:Ubiquitin carboxyl-terminal hydrolase MINDY n=1 Tax=Myripristis murdjan TaxID=586833 RepID=A0A668ANS7_9TELE